MKLDLSEKLTAQRIKKGYNKRQLAELVGVSATAIGQFESARNYPKTEVLLKLGKVLEYDFINDVESNAKQVAPINFPYNLQEEDNSKFIDLGDGQYLMIVPMVNEYAYMGYAAGYRDPEYMESLPKHTIIVNKHHKGYYQAFEAVGESMENWTNEELARESIPNGARVTGREIAKHYWTSKFHTHKFPDFIVVHKDGIVIKRMKDHRVKEGIIVLSSLNPDKDLYPDFEYHLDDVNQIFNVIDVSVRRA